MKQHAFLGFFLLACLAAGGLGSIAATRSVAEWYPALVKPSWNPPSGLFGPVWTLLYILMGVAAWRVWRAAGSFSGARTALSLFFFQLALNAAWSWIFFGLRMPGPALLELSLLWGAIAATIRIFANIDAAAAWFMSPYIA
ncbi:MAG: TspO/MBR family protein [Thermovirgaceae bacterium]|nr:TspO/MBR family protein [Thermovirgaceae bacterium]